MTNLSSMPEESRAAFENVCKHLEELAEGIRDISHRLHPDIIEDLGLPEALRALVDEHNRSGSEVVLLMRDVPRKIPLATATTLYRIVQEGLRNAAKHASGSAVQVALEGKLSDLELKIQDTGPGFSAIEVRSKGGLGLLSMQERARLAGGKLMLGGRPGEGTVLLVRVPV